VLPEKRHPKKYPSAKLILAPAPSPVEVLPMNEVL